MEQHQFRKYAVTTQSYNFMGRGLNLENGSFAQTRGNLTSEVHFRHYANPRSRLNVHPVSSFSSEMHCIGPASSGPSYSYHPCSSLAGNSSYIPNHGHPQFAGYIDRGIHGVIDATIAAERIPFKRKSPDTPMAFERGSSSRSGLLRKPFGDNQILSRYPVSFHQYSGSNHSVASNDSVRNVRSRYGLNSTPTSISNHLNFASPPHHTTVPINQSVAARYPHSNADASAAWNFHFASPHGPGRIHASETNGLSSEANQFLVERRAVEVGQYSRDAIASRYVVPQSQYLHFSPPRYRSHGQRAMPSYTEQARHYGYGATSYYRQQFPGGAYSSRYARRSSTGTWHTSYHSDGARSTIEGFPSLARTMGRSDSMGTQHHVIADYYRVSFSPGDTDTYDQYEDMRLDIDHMSYEDLLALGERIGNVKTGLSEDMMSNCLVEFLYCATEQNQEEKICSICLEKFSNLEKLGSLRNCGHEYHVGCITEWLGVKNICPICKRSVGSNP